MSLQITNNIVNKEFYRLDQITLKPWAREKVNNTINNGTIFVAFYHRETCYPNKIMVGYSESSVSICREIERKINKEILEHHGNTLDYILVFPFNDNNISLLREKNPRFRTVKRLDRFLQMEFAKIFVRDTTSGHREHYEKNNSERIILHDVKKYFELYGFVNENEDYLHLFSELGYNITSEDGFEDEFSEDEESENDTTNDPDYNLGDLYQMIQEGAKFLGNDLSNLMDTSDD